MKKSRQEKIVELVSKCDIETQEELADRLRAAGFSVTQATISRDIRELHLTKVLTRDGRQKYAVLNPPRQQMEEKYIRVLKDGFLSMDMAQNILVVKTVSGMAMAVAAALDALQLEGMVGCIAGDDTVMCAVRTLEDTHGMMAEIKALISQQ